MSFFTTPALFVPTILVVFLVLVGVMYALYRGCCRAGSDGDGFRMMEIQSSQYGRPEAAPRTLTSYLEAREMEQNIARGGVAGFRSHDNTTQALIDARFYLRGHDEYDLKAALPEMGWRGGKSYFLVRHKGTGNKYAMTMIPTAIDYEATHGKTIVDMLYAINHPLVHETHFAEYLPNKRMLVVFRPLTKKGSVKDYVYRVDNCKDSYDDKYGPGHPAEGLDVDRVAKIGRQVLEGLIYFRDAGFPFGHLHSGNVIVHNGSCKLTDYENCVLGLAVKGRPSRAKIPPPPTAADEVAAFARLLYELCCGEELNTPSVVHFTPDFPRTFRKIILGILEPKDKAPTLDQVLTLPVFQNVRLKERPSRFFLELTPQMQALLHHAKQGTAAPKRRVKRDRGGDRSNWGTGSSAVFSEADDANDDDDDGSVSVLSMGSSRGGRTLAPEPEDFDVDDPYGILARSQGSSRGAASGAGRIAPPPRKSLTTSVRRIDKKGREDEAARLEREHQAAAAALSASEPARTAAPPPPATTAAAAAPTASDPAARRNALISALDS